MQELFAQIKGHKQQISELKRLISSKSMPHAFIFTGSNGIGKRSCAIAASAELLAKNSETLESSRALVFAGNHPDLHLAAREDGKKDISVESIRELRDRLQLKPYLGGSIVALIDEAEQMNASAYNALLKTLEEPNPNTYLFLITNSLHALPDTIRSRCQTLHFSNLEDLELTEVLLHLCPALSNKQEQVEKLGELAQGSVELLGLNRFCDSKRISIEESKKVEKQILTQAEQFSELCKNITKIIGSRDTTLALSYASEISAKKDQDNLFWPAIRKSLRERLKNSPTRLSAEALDKAISAEQLAKQRNVNLGILSSELLCLAAEIK